MTLPLTLPSPLPLTLSPPLQPGPRPADAPGVMPGQPAAAPAPAGQSFSSMIEALGPAGAPAQPGSATQLDGAQLASATPPETLTVHTQLSSADQALFPLPQPCQTPGPAMPANEAESLEESTPYDPSSEMSPSPENQRPAIEIEPASRPFMQPLLTIEPGRSPMSETAVAETATPLEMPGEARPDSKPLMAAHASISARPGIDLPDIGPDRQPQPMPAPDHLDDRWITSLALAVDRAADGKGPDLTLRSANLGLIQFGLDKIADSFVLTLNASSDSSAALMAAAQDRLLREATAQNLRLSVNPSGVEQYVGSGDTSAGDGRGHGAPMAHDSRRSVQSSPPVASERRNSEQSVDHGSGNVRHRFA